MEPAEATHGPGLAAQPEGGSSREPLTDHQSVPVEILLRLNRAVQRATVYPAGHPTVRSAALSFWRTLETILTERSTLTLGVTHERLLLDEEPLGRAQETLSWLNRRLHDRHLAAIVFARGTSQEDVLGLIAWLADPTDSEDMPALEGILLSRVDYARATFDQGRRSEPEDAMDPAKVWRSLLTGLAAGWYDGDPEALPDEPEQLAERLCDEIHRNEGVGGAALIQAITSAGMRLPRIAEPARRTVKARLAALTTALSPDIREQLLRVDAHTSARRLDALTDLVDALPDTTLMDLLADLDTRDARLSGSFLNLLNKLIALSVRSPDMRELAETKLVTLGLPRGLTLMEPSRVRSMLEGMLVQESRDWTPGDYQKTLDDLSEKTVAPAEVLRRYEDLASREPIAEHTLEIVLRLLVALPDHSEAPEYARRLLEDAPRALAARRFVLLREVAASMRDLLVLRQYLQPEVLEAAEQYLDLIRAEPVVGRILDELLAPEAPPSPDLADLFRMSGVDGALQAFARLAAATDDRDRERLSALLATLKPDTMLDTVARLRQQGGSALEALFLVLARPETPGRVECALTFVGNRDPGVRRRALQTLIEADQRPGQVQRYLERALADSHPTVQEFALTTIETIGGNVALEALEAFLLDREGAAASPGARLRAVDVLTRLGAEPARKAFCAHLRARRRALRLSEIRLSATIAARLQEDDHEDARAALGAWRRSPAGLWAHVLRVFAPGHLREAGT
jgi:hypothetical protein